MTLLFGALVILVSGGLLAAALSRWPRAASLVGAGSAALGSLAGAVFAARHLGGAPVQAAFAWRVPEGGIVLACDPLSAFFLLPVFVLGGIAAVYGHDYLFAYRAHKSMGPPWLAYDWLLASMALVVTARHAVLFLVAWEVMSLASFVLVTFEHEHAEARRAGFVYLVAAHVGTAFLIALFVLLGSATRTFVFGEAALGAPLRTTILLFAVVGFGVKAGLVPLHVWLPEAHAAAPSHVSALMSGALTKMGVYGILRVTLLVGPWPAWWGGLLMLLGLGGAIYGITLATYQRDIKRALAYSTIENIGLLFLGLGLGLWGHAAGHPIIGALGIAGGLLHAWNHTLMKGLLFLGAGAVVHATGTKDIERLGGLMRRAPAASALFFLGAVAIAGLPPLNGFTGEWLLYRSLLEGAVTGAPLTAVAFMAAVAVLSAVGALAALCFVRLAGVALLGEPRSEEARRARDASPAMLLPMGALGALCVLVGARPRVVATAIEAVAARLAPVTQTSAGVVQAALAPVEGTALALWGAGLSAATLLLFVVRHRRAASGPRADVAQTASGVDTTWGCGYAAPTMRMQYTGRAFAGVLAELLPRALGPRVEITRPSGLFPAPGGVSSTLDDPVTRGVYQPALTRAADRAARLRWMQRGMVHIYLLYILLALVAGLAWTSLGGWAAG